MGKTRCKIIFELEQGITVNDLLEQIDDIYVERHEVQAVFIDMLNTNDYPDCVKFTDEK